MGDGIGLIRWMRGLNPFSRKIPGVDATEICYGNDGGLGLRMWASSTSQEIGHALAPVLKVTGNAVTARRMADNMDIDVLGIVEGTLTITDAGEKILGEVLEVVGGRVTKAEAYGFSDITVDHVCRFI